MATVKKQEETTTGQELLGKSVMIRTNLAGVHFGTLDSCVDMPGDSYRVKLTNARRVYKWAGACSLSQLSVDGTTNTETLISVPVPSIYLKGIEIIEMTDKAEKALTSLKTWKI